MIEPSELSYKTISGQYERLKKGGQETDRKQKGRKGIFVAQRASSHKVKTKKSAALKRAAQLTTERAFPFRKLEMNK